MSETIEIHVPIRLISEANKLDHWTKKHRRTKKVKAMLEIYWPKDFVPVLPCTIELIRVAPRRFDSDNLQSSLKSCRDFVADKLSPGLQPGRADDNPKLSFRYDQHRGKVREYGLIIRLTF